MRKIALVALVATVLTACTVSTPPAPPENNETPPAQAWRDKLACEIQLGGC